MNLTINSTITKLDTLRQTELMIVVCSLLLTVVDEKNSKCDGGSGGDGRKQ